MILDKQFYLIFEADRAGNIWLAEREMSDMDIKTTITDIADGQFSDLVSVIEFNPIENTSRDVTEDMARFVLNEWVHVRGEPLTDIQREFVSFHLGESVASQFRLQAAE